MSQSPSVGMARFLAIILMAAHDTLLAQDEILSLKRPDEVFQEPIQSDELGGELQRQLAQEEQSSQFVTAPDDPFPTGDGATGQISGQRPLGIGGPGSERAPFQSQLFWIPQQALKGQPGNLSMSGEEVELGFPISIDSNGIWLRDSRAGVETNCQSIPAWR